LPLRQRFLKTWQLTSFFGVTVFVQLGFLDPMLIALNWPMVINKLQAAAGSGGLKTGEALKNRGKIPMRHFVGGFLVYLIFRHPPFLEGFFFAWTCRE